MVVRPWRQRPWRLLHAQTETDSGAAERGQDQSEARCTGLGASLNVDGETVPGVFWD